MLGIVGETTGTQKTDPSQRAHTLLQVGIQARSKSKAFPWQRIFKLGSNYIPPNKALEYKEML